MTIQEFWELMQNDPIKKHNEIKESKTMEFINKEQIIDKLRERAKFNKKEFERADAGADIVHHRAKWMAFQEAIRLIQECDVKDTEENPVKSEKEASKTLNKVTITRTGSNEIAFKLNGQPVGWLQLMAHLLPGMPCTFGQFCSRELNIQSQRQLTHCKTRLNFHTMEFSKELDCFNGTPQEIEQGFKERIYRITKWIEEHKASVIEFEV